MAVGFVSILAALAVVGGGVSYFTFPVGLKAGLEQAINLKENGMVYPLYMNPPFGSTTLFKIFSIKNPKEVLTGGKANLELKGPYYYRTSIYRDKISFTEKRETVKFDSHRKLSLDEQNSANLDEKFWMINPTLPTLAVQVRSLVLDRIPFARVSEPIIFNSVNVFLDNYKERLIVKRSPRELLEGKKVELLEFVQGIAGRFGLASLVPPGPPDNVFGLAYVQNETIDRIEINTGITESKKFADVLKWKDNDKMKIWEGKCNQIRGTNGELYKPMIVARKNSSIQVFVSQVCRTFNLDPVNADVIEVQNGLEALEYEFSPRMYQGARTNPGNRCYCKDKQSYDCQYDGLMNMGPCFFDAPIYFARPNFMGVDRKIMNLVNRSSLANIEMFDKQSFFLDPITSSILKVNLTLVANVKVKRQPYLRDMARIQNLTYMSFFAASETVELPKSVTWQLSLLQSVDKYYKPANIMMVLGGSGMLLMKFAFAKPQPAAAAA